MESPIEGRHFGFAPKTVKHELQPPGKTPAPTWIAGIRCWKARGEDKGAELVDEGRLTCPHRRWGSRAGGCDPPPQTKRPWRSLT